MSLKTSTDASIIKFDSMGILANSQKEYTNDPALQTISQNIHTGQ
jgi:hypothetical protein